MIFFNLISIPLNVQLVALTLHGPSSAYDSSSPEALELIFGTININSENESIEVRLLQLHTNLYHHHKHLFH